MNLKDKMKKIGTKNLNETEILSEQSVLSTLRELVVLNKAMLAQLEKMPKKIQ
jgi:hypothetical protein|tara:strand:- start:3321 stop:3479 length:159 start_codon:yes stop_codon:yes gene_type:complete